MFKTPERCTTFLRRQTRDTQNLLLGLSEFIGRSKLGVALTKGNMADGKQMRRETNLAYMAADQWAIGSNHPLTEASYDALDAINMMRRLRTAKDERGTVDAIFDFAVALDEEIKMLLEMQSGLAKTLFPLSKAFPEAGKRFTSLGWERPAPEPEPALTAADPDIPF
jgi:hypothetical protein